MAFPTFTMPAAYHVLGGDARSSCDENAQRIDTHAQFVDNRLHRQSGDSSANSVDTSGQVVGSSKRKCASGENSPLDHDAGSFAAPSRLGMNYESLEARPPSSFPNPATTTTTTTSGPTAAPSAPPGVSEPSRQPATAESINGVLMRQLSQRLSDIHLEAIKAIQEQILAAIAVGAIPAAQALTAIHAIPLLISQQGSTPLRRFQTYAGNGIPPSTRPLFDPRSVPNSSAFPTLPTFPPSFPSLPALSRLPPPVPLSSLPDSAPAFPTLAAPTPAPAPAPAPVPQSTAFPRITPLYPSFTPAPLPTLSTVPVPLSAATMPTFPPASLAPPPAPAPAPAAAVAGADPTASVSIMTLPLPDDIQAVYQQESTGDVNADPTLLTLKAMRETGDKWLSPLDVAPTVTEVVDAATRVSAGAEDDCSVCLERFTPGQQVLKLHRCHPGHYFHKECITMALTSNMRCPNCTTQYGVPSGPQPPGRMAITLQPFRLPGEDTSYGTYMIAYQFPSGYQTERHPSPGTPYAGTSRRAFIPGTPHGRRVLKKFLRAWDARVLFTVGTSVTTGKPNCVIWNGIHHKTNVGGGPCQFGFPDATYLDSVEAELASAGIV